MPVATTSPAATRRAGAPYPWLKPGIFIGALLPLVSIAVRGSMDALGADPIAKVENELGLAALVLLVASLACTPARRVLGWTWPIRIRRELGLFAFFYACLHVVMYVVVDQSIMLGAIIDDIVKRPFITVGFLAFVLLTPLALTSTPESIRQMGFRRWQRLHMLVYLAGVLAIIHFVWRVKIDVAQPLTYAWIVLGLLLIRVVFWLRRRNAPAKSA